MIITSKKFVNAEKSRGSLFDTTTFGLPHLSIFSFKMRARDLITSLLTNNECSFINPAINVDLPPGAAHKSKIFNGFILSA